jgi:hypothetical protein
MNAKSVKLMLTILLAALLLLAAPAAMQAQFTYTTNDGAITITGYTGSGGAVTIPPTINGLSVTSIGHYAFAGTKFFGSDLTSITIPASVTSIGDWAFGYCYNLTSVYFEGNAPTVGSEVFFDDNATVYYLAGTTGWGYTFAGLTAVLSNPQAEFGYTTNAGAITITNYIGPGGAVLIPATITGLPVTTIGGYEQFFRIPLTLNGRWIGAFESCTTLTSVTIPGSVTNIETSAFESCASLTSVYFESNAPTVGSDVFFADTNATVFYLPGTTGWSSPFAGLPAVLVQLTPANMVLFSQPANNATLVVTLLPPEANAQWRFPWELAWRQSGTAATNLVPNENYIVEFSSVPGYLAIPAQETIFVADGQTNITGQYYPTITSVGLTTGGSLEVVFQTNPPGGAGWRLLGDTNPFHPSGFTTNLLAGNYLIEFALLNDFAQIPIQSVQISTGVPTVLQEIYQPSQPAPAGFLLPTPVLSANIGNLAVAPYGFNGQLETDVGYGSGVAVEDNVVLTAAHLVFNDQSLSYVSQAWWYPREEAPQFVPEPQPAQGWLIVSGYASQRTNDLQTGLYPGQSSPQSRNFDVAALYFKSPVAGGGYGGYLASDVTPNYWLTSTANKGLVGYPVDGSLFQVPGLVPGQMYRIGPYPYPLSLATNALNDQQVYTASWFLSCPGNTGGPFYVQFNGYYYPAGVYLGTLFNGTVPYASAVRAIDSNIVSLITNSQAISTGRVSVATGQGVGGGVVILASQNIAINPGAVEVTISPPAAFTAGGAWELSTLPNAYYSTENPSTFPVTSTNPVQLQFKQIAGWNLPPTQSVTAVPGTVTNLTSFYTLALSWATPAPITFGTPLGPNQLDAAVPAITDGTSGNYIYNPTIGTVLSVGTYTLSVTFTPSNTTDYGTASVTTNVTLVVSPAPLVGSLNVTISPASAICAGAQWQVDGTTWQSSGATVTNLSEGDHSISFKPISDWVIPSNQIAFISNGITTSAVGNYILVNKGNPQLTVASPKSGQTMSNAFLLLKGTVTDKVAVDCVCYQLNTNSWTLATPSNSWSNWTASVTLNPGTNTISAYALDASGTFSPTNTVKFVYVVTGALQVTLSPPAAVSDGAQWRVDVEAFHDSGVTVSNLLAGNHTLSFKSVSGFATPSNQAVSIAGSQVTLATGAYRDTNRPTLTILSPTANLRVSNAVFTVTGKAADNVTVSNVLYQLNNDGWSNAVPTNHWTNWTATVTPAPGSNTLQAYAVDTSANYSLTNTVHFTYIPSATLTVKTNGLGSVTPIDNGKLLAIGTNYTLNASPGHNWIFSNWVASDGENFVSNNPVLKFAMHSNLVLQANFVTNPFLAIYGTYNGLFCQTNAGSPVTEQSSGFATVTIASGGKGAYSAVLKLDGGSSSFSGALDLNGNSVTNVTRKGKSPLTLTLHIDLNLSPPADYMTGSVDASNWAGPSGLIADLAYFNGTTIKASNYAGKYTLVLPGSNAPATSPGGYSVAEFINNLAGTAVLTGSLADNTTISSLSTPISKDGFVPIYYSYSSGTNVIFGWLNFTNVPPQTVQGDLTWFKLPTASKVLYSNGFTFQTNVIGSLYAPVTTNTLVTNGTLTIVDLAQGINLLYTNVSIISNKLTYAATTTNQLTATITSSTGAISLSFRPTGAKANLTAQGVILPNSPIDPSLKAAGWFAGANQTGYFLLTH